MNAIQDSFAPNEIERTRTRFFSHVEKTHRWWLWLAGKQVGGYGKTTVYLPRKYTTTAHRISWMLHFGEIADGMMVCHRCDNPPCVNPTHLFLETLAGNMADMSAKGRANPPRFCGEDNPTARLTADLVREIVKLSRCGLSRSAVAVALTIPPGLVSEVMCGRTWNRVAARPRFHSMPWLRRADDPHADDLC